MDGIGREDLVGLEVESDRPEMLLQYLVLGMLMARPELRNEIDAGNFSASNGMAAAVSELKSGKGRQAWPFLQKILLTCGVEWDEKEPPVKRVLRRLKLDSETARALNFLCGKGVELIRRTVTDAKKADFLRAVMNARSVLRLDMRVCDGISSEERKAGGNEQGGGKVS